MPLQLPFLILKFWSFLSFYYSYFLSFLGIHYGVLSTRASKSLPLLYQRLSLLSIKRFVKVTRLSRINSVNAPSSQKKMTGLKVHTCDHISTLTLPYLLILYFRLVLVWFSYLESVRLFIYIGGRRCQLNLSTGEPIFQVYPLILIIRKIFFIKESLIH